MKLFVDNPYQNVFEVIIESTSKVIDLKRIISAEINGLMEPNQILKYRSKTLLDSDTIQTYGIQNGSVIELTVQNNFNIFIRTEDDQIHKLDVHFTATAGLVKKLLNRSLKIAVDEQRLLFNGKELKNDDILTEKSITRGTTIHLVLAKLKLRLNIVQQSGQVGHIEIPINYTVAQLKQVISAKYQLPENGASLKYNGQELDNNGKTLAEYNVGDLSEIHFRRKDIEIHIQSASIGQKRITFRIFPYDTVGKVKDKIEAELKINKVAQQLIWGGRVLSDDAILSIENIYGGSTLNLVVAILSLTLNIQIGHVSRKIKIETSSSETVAQLKTKLFNAVNIPIDQQILFVDNTKLEDGKILMDYGLNETSDIALQRKDSFEIIIEKLDGRGVSIHVHKDDKVLDLKNQIDRRLGVAPKTQRLYYFGEVLRSRKTLEEYRIVGSCTIHLVIRLDGGAELVLY